jgi:hypothetical protein
MPKMGTTYRKFLDVLGSISVAQIGQDTAAVSFFGPAGESYGRLIMPRGSVYPLLDALATKVVIRTYFGGAARGTVVNELVDGLDPGDVVFSDEGALVTVAEVRALDGAGRNLDKVNKLKGGQP